MDNPAPKEGNPMGLTRCAVSLSAILLAGLILSGVSYAGDPSPLKIGARSTSVGPRVLIERYQPLMEYLSAKTGRPVEFHPVVSVPDVHAKLVSGDLDAVILGSSGAARAVRDLGAIPVARPEKGGISGYRGCVIVRKDSKITKIEELKGKRFDYVEKGASAGHIYPRSVLVGRKLDPDAFFGTATFVGKHDIAVMKVLNRESDGASVKEQDFEKLSRSDPRVREEILVLQKSGLYPDGTLLFRKGTAPETVKAVEKALLGIGKDPGGKDALASVGADRYIPTGRKDFAELIKAMALAKE